MIDLNAVRELRALITSTRVTYNGAEVMQVANLVNQLTAEERTQVLQQRVVPRSVAAAVDQPVTGASAGE